MAIKILPIIKSSYCRQLNIRRTPTYGLLRGADNFPPDTFPLDSIPPDSIPPRHFPTTTLSHHDTFPPRHFPTTTLSHHDTFPPRHFPTTTLSHHDIFPLFPTILCDIFPLEKLFSLCMNSPRFFSKSRNPVNRLGRH